LLSVHTNSLERTQFIRTQPSTLELDATVKVTGTYKVKSGCLIPSQKHPVSCTDFMTKRKGHLHAEAAYIPKFGYFHLGLTEDTGVKFSVSSEFQKR